MESLSRQEGKLYVRSEEYERARNKIKKLELEVSLLKRKIRISQEIQRLAPESLQTIYSI